MSVLMKHQLPILPAPGPGRLHSTFCLYEFDSEIGISHFSEGGGSSSRLYKFPLAMTVIQSAQFAFLDVSAGNVLGSGTCYQGLFGGEVTAEALSWEEGATS